MLHRGNDVLIVLFSVLLIAKGRVVNTLINILKVSGSLRGIVHGDIEDMSNDFRWRIKAKIGNFIENGIVAFMADT